MSAKTEIVACRASYCKSFFDHFPASEFFNSHACHLRPRPAKRHESRASNCFVFSAGTATFDPVFVIYPSTEGGRGSRVSCHPPQYSGLCGSDQIKEIRTERLMVR
jgi:hypothetical protein